MKGGFKDLKSNLGVQSLSSEIESLGFRLNAFFQDLDVCRTGLGLLCIRLALNSSFLILFSCSPSFRVEESPWKSLVKTKCPRQNFINVCRARRLKR